MLLLLQPQCSLLNGQRRLLLQKLVNWLAAGRENRPYKDECGWLIQFLLCRNCNRLRLQGDVNAVGLRKHASILRRRLMQ